MPYSAEISRANPTCILFLVDQSTSMEDPFGGESGKIKAEGTADALNRLLQTLVFRCAKGETILDRYFIGVIGYGDSVGWALGGALAGQALVPVGEIGRNPLRVEQRSKKVDDGAGGLVEQTVKFPVWFEPVADGYTPMCEALRLAREAVFDFVSRCPGCFPPIVINVTDGEANDGDPEPVADDLRDIASDDGNVLLFNVHISSVDERPIQFPDDENQLPDEAARLLFRMSSRLPPDMAAQARSMGAGIGECSRGFVFNADLVSVIQFLDIGTRIDQNLR